jgi:hypothetical protein
MRSFWRRQYAGIRAAPSLFRRRIIMSQDHEIEVETERVRSGIELHRMRFVLGFGLLGAGAAVLLAWAWF